MPPEDRWALLLHRVNESYVRRVCSMLRGYRIEAVTFKGWAAGRHYPPLTPRHYGDIDIAVAPSDFETAKQLIQRESIHKLNVDLHKGFRHLDTLTWDELFRNCEVVELDGVKVRVPRAEDHLRILCVHWLTDGGIHKHRLWDIYYLVTNHNSNFNWERCLDTVSKRRRRWIICTIGLAHRYLDLPIDELPFRKEAENIPDWVVRCVEREWKRGGNIEPILASLHDSAAFFEQVSRRLPPNPLRAMVECEGDIDNPHQFTSQLRVLGRRALPFFRDSLDLSLIHI